MNLHEVTLAETGFAAAHVGSIRVEELGRVLAEPRAVLQEAGLPVADDTPIRIHASRERDSGGEEIIIDLIFVVVIFFPDGTVVVILVW